MSRIVASGGFDQTIGLLTLLKRPEGFEVVSDVEIEHPKQKLP